MDPDVFFTLEVSEGVITKITNPTIAAIDGTRIYTGEFCVSDSLNFIQISDDQSSAVPGLFCAPFIKPVTFQNNLLISILFSPDSTFKFIGPSPNLHLNEDESWTILPGSSTAYVIYISTSDSVYLTKLFVGSSWCIGAIYFTNGPPYSAVQSSSLPYGKISVDNQTITFTGPPPTFTLINRTLYPIVIKESSSSMFMLPNTNLVWNSNTNNWQINPAEISKTAIIPATASGRLIPTDITSYKCSIGESVIFTLDTNCGVYSFQSPAYGFNLPENKDGVPILSAPAIVFFNETEKAITFLGDASAFTGPSSGLTVTDGVWEIPAYNPNGTTYGTIGTVSNEPEPIQFSIGTINLFKVDFTKIPIEITEVAPGYFVKLELPESEPRIVIAKVS